VNRDPKMSKTENPSPWIIDADDQTFQQLAVERSRELPVVIDFWAEWCGPCRMLGPILEKLAGEYGGKFVLVKVETEKAPSIAAAFGVQSIPAVYGLRDGQLLDYFVGLLPEGQIRSWIDRLLPSPAEQMLADARALIASDPQGAEVKFKEAAAADPNLAPAKIGLAELLLQQGQVEAAIQLLDELEQRGFLEPEAERLKAQLHMAAQADKGVDLEQLRAAVEADPRNLQAKLDLAQGLAASKQFQQALDTALSLVQSGKKEFVEPARQLMVDLFRLLDEQPELVTEYRRKLSTALY
jgi:putative thioredoxin